MESTFRPHSACSPYALTSTRSAASTPHALTFLNPQTDFADIVQSLYIIAHLLPIPISTDLMMKRLRVESEIHALEMADCLISLSKPITPSFSGRVFVCKTCNREFSSFQALGGHRASHRKPKLSPASGDGLQSNAIKTKAHECSICGVDFPVGQALGGHMRRHRNSSPATDCPPPVAQPVSDDSDCDGGVVGLDLNLTPLENDLVRLQLMAPPVGCFT